MVNEKSITLTPHEIKKLKRFRNTLTESGYRRTIILFHDSNGEIIRNNKGEVFEHKINTEYIDNRMAGQMFHLWPEPEKLDDFNQYIIMAKEQNDLKYFWFFLHFFEPSLTEYAKYELRRRGHFNYCPERLMNAKYDYLFYLLKKFLYFKPSFKTKFTTYIFNGMANPVIYGLSNEEAWTYDTLNQYKNLRSAGYQLNENDGSFDDAVKEYMKIYNCSRQTAEEHITAADGHRLRTDFFVRKSESNDPEDTNAESTEDVTIDEFWDSNNRMETSIPRSVIIDALGTLSEKEKYVIKKYNAICIRCNQNKPLKSKYTFSEISERFESSYKSESAVLKAYNKAIEKLIIYLAERDFISAVKINLIKTKKQKGKIVYAEFSYQPFDSAEDDNPGIVSYSLIGETGNYIIPQPADRDDYKNLTFGNFVGNYILSIPSSTFPKEKLLGIEKAAG